MVTCIGKSADKCPFSLLSQKDVSNSVPVLTPDAVDVSNTLLSQTPCFLGGGDATPCFLGGGDATPCFLGGGDATPITAEIQKFKLPISYLDAGELYTINDTVSTDLELITNEGSSGMYSYLFQPTHSFARDLIPLWRKQYTTNTGFLQDTQNILKQFDAYKNSETGVAYKPDCEVLTEIWNTVKRDEGFLGKYSFVDWEQFAFLNQSEPFLQLMSYLNIVSPVLSLLTPIVMMIFPFLLLKIQNIPISFATYLETLKEIAKNHFIGKTLFSLESFSWDKVVYLLFTVGLYCLQIYQNINKCRNFYTNTKKINGYLVEMQRYTRYSIHSMKTFLDICGTKTSYLRFSCDVERHCKQMQKLEEQLAKVTEFCHDFKKVNCSGYMLKCFYELHANPEFEESLRFSMGFEAYINNMLGVYENLVGGHVHYAAFDACGSCVFRKQYYPPLKRVTDVVKNDCDLSKNVILSAPNKAGKTTVLKTTTLNILFTQQVGCGFYAGATLQPYTHIHSYINIPDTSGRDSLFQAESRRCKDIIDIIIDNNDAAKYRHFCIFDELYSGTNPTEACKAGCAFLAYLAKYPNVKFMLTTHYLAICKKFKKTENVQNYKMRVNVLSNGQYEYTYKMQKGISRRKGALQVLKDMDYPAEIINNMETIL